MDYNEFIKSIHQHIEESAKEINRPAFPKKIRIKIKILDPPKVQIRPPIKDFPDELK
jgi:hypothetical protein